MFVDDQTFFRGKKKYRRVLLRNSYRVNGKICHDSIANLSKCSDDEIHVFRLALKHKDQLKTIQETIPGTRTKQGLAVGALWLLHQLAKRLGIIKALGYSREAKLILWLIYATLIEPGSRLSAVRLAQRHAACDILNLDSFNEDDLYAAMDWLDERQPTIEKRLFAGRYKDHQPELFLYDVTSSYFEGMCNELSDWGYSRDKKNGKKQIVIGLMTDEEGFPISIEVFRGNTQDLTTFVGQTQKVSNRFHCQGVTFVGDRGMIKGPQIAGLDPDCHYITAISKVEIETLLDIGILQMELFEEVVCEVEDGDIRYIIRRNPHRAEQIAKTRLDKLASLEKLVRQRNHYLSEHPRATIAVAKRKAETKAAKLKIDSWAKIDNDHRTLRIRCDQSALDDKSKLDGCYVIKSDLDKAAVSAVTIHDRYKSLSDVEWAFRTMKTTLLELRAIFVRKAPRTRAHVFIMMMAYMIAYELRRLWHDVELTVEEGINELASLCATEVIINGVSCQTVPEPRPLGKTLLEKADIALPDAIPSRNIVVDTRRKLVSRRKTNSISNSYTRKP